MYCICWGGNSSPPPPLFNLSIGPIVFFYQSYFFSPTSKILKQVNNFIKHNELYWISEAKKYWLKWRTLNKNSPLPSHFGVSALSPQHWQWLCSPITVVLMSLPMTVQPAQSGVLQWKAPLMFASASFTAFFSSRSSTAKLTSYTI